MSQLVRIYENELLKSYSERLYRINHYLTMGVFFEEMFGGCVLRIHPYVPSYIKRIVGGLGECFLEEEVITNHTLYHFYTAFQGKDVQEDIYNKMIIDKGNAYKIVKYNEIPITQYYRYCPVCIKEQLQQYGDFSWNRIHQIAPVCTKHNVWIQESMIPIRYKINEYAKHWIKLDLRGMCKIENDEKSKNTVLEKATQISKLIEKLILGRYSKDITLEILRDAYFFKLKEEGWVYQSGESIRITELTQQVETYFTKELLNRIGIDAEKCIIKTVNRFSDMVHPLYHVVMIVFLQLDLDKEIQISTNRILDIPVYCLNPLSNHEDKHIIDDIKVHYCYITKQFMCTFSCCCGFVFTTRKDEVIRSNGTKIGKIKKYGKDYEENLLKLRDLGIKGIARKTGMNHGTIRKQLRRFNQYGTIIPQKELLKEVKYTTDEIATTITKRIHLESKWEKKDTCYYELIAHAIEEELKGEKKPRRITRTRIAKEINAIHAVIYKIDKMPMSKTLIDQYQETQIEYYKRKIRWVITLFEEKKEEVMEWKVLEEVGCSQENRELVKMLIKEILLNNSNR